LLLAAARPLGESVARYGPFVMNTRAEIEQALHELRTGRFIREEPPDASLGAAAPGRRSLELLADSMGLEPANSGADSARCESGKNKRNGGFGLRLTIAGRQGRGLR
jgi:Pirin C-terminal cupin domain